MPMLRRGEDVTIGGQSIRIPIHRLPPEILSEIFLLLPSSCTEWYDVFDMSRPPWSLGHVCSSWRSTVVSSCRSIWSNPWIPFSSANGDIGIELCDPISLLQTALERSGNHELSFSFSYGDLDELRSHLKDICGLRPQPDDSVAPIQICLQSLQTGKRRPRSRPSQKR
ncbi:hypothetical protein ARMGADRAFT_625206 [Armillaria gallica]|uniref:F-box domain-containing protein n=1 Tax=Armillaria gallica TaxID=47427 RepID=A0A2H3DSU7_ARMGA|nr:hypothetical protein ARMGADRAFT_625206 [Armillaria gallica]